MYHNKSISVVIPCHNEDEAINKIIKSLPKEIDEIIVVDNNSTDKTAQIAQTAGAIVVFEPTQGYGRAYKTGLSKAKGEIIVTLDGDSQYPAEEIINLIKFLIDKKIDFLSGSRFPLSNPESISRTRLIGNKILTWLTNFLFKTKIKDSQSGMWVFKKTVLSKFSLISNGMPFSEEIKIKTLLEPKLRFAEKNINYYPRIGESKLFPFKDGFRNLIFLFKLRWQYRKRKEKILLPLLFIFFFFAFIFYLIQFSSPNLAGVDAYYHIKYAYLYRTLGIKETLNNFSLAGEYSILKQYPTDLSFLYHVFLIPLTYGDLIVGSKILAVIFASLIFSLFYWILRKSQIKYSFFWTLLFFTASSAFISRLTLSRPFLLSILILILGFYLIIKKKYGWLFILSIFYALSYAVSPLILVIAFIYIIAEYLQIKKIDWKLLFYPFMGILIGLIIRPDFPQDFYTIFVQNFYTFFYKIKGVSLGIGAEMSLISAPLKTNLILLFLFSLALAFIIIDLIRNRIKKGRLSLIRLYTCLLATFFCLLTLMSQRFFEYWTPFTLFLAAFTFKYISEDKYWRDLFKRFLQIIGNFFSRLRLFLFILLCLIIILSGYINISGAINPIKDADLSFNRYQEAGQWLKENTPAQSIIFNASWDNFPQLFFYNHHNYYIIGKDPTFMYVYDKELFWLWGNIISQGIICSQSEKECPDAVYTEKFSQRRQKIYQIIKNRFQSEYVFIDNQSMSDQSQRHQIFKKLLENSSLFEEVYQSQKYPEVMIFQLK